MGVVGMSFMRRRGKFPKKKNKKIKNATTLEYDGIKFKSKLEAFCYRHLKENGIEAEYEKNTYVLIPAFEYNGEKVRQCTYTPDFVNKHEGFVIEIKGFANDVFPIKWKMFKYLLNSLKSKYKLYLPKNQSEVLSVIQSIK